MPVPVAEQPFRTIIPRLNLLLRELDRRNRPAPIAGSATAAARDAMCRWSISAACISSRLSRRPIARTLTGSHLLYRSATFPLSAMP